MGYNIDLNLIPVFRYKEILKNQDLLPGRRLLLDNIDEIFHEIADSGINTLAELKANISTPARLAAFASKHSIPEKYLTILKREMGSLAQKPVPLSDFPGISADTVSLLSAKNIKTSKDVYDLAVNADNLSAASQKTGVSADELQELSGLCSLVRINGVGAIAARTLYESGYKSVAEVARAKATKLLESMNAVNANKRYYKANLGEKDMRFIIDFAGFLEKH